MNVLDIQERLNISKLSLVSYTHWWTLTMPLPRTFWRQVRFCRLSQLVAGFYEKNKIFTHSTVQLTVNTQLYSFFNWIWKTQCSLVVLVLSSSWCLWFKAADKKFENVFLICFFSVTAKTPSPKLQFFALEISFPKKTSNLKLHNITKIRDIQIK